MAFENTYNFTFSSFLFFNTSSKIKVTGKGGEHVGALMLDITLLGLGIIGATAFLGVAMNGIGNKLFSRGKKDEFLDKARSYQDTWRNVGGTQK